jgi:cyclic nucleotide-binding protein/MFS transporter
VSGRLAVVARVVVSPRLRRVAIAFAGFAAAEYAVWTAMLVYAYDHGGTTTAGLVAVLQLVPAALVAPPAATLADLRGGTFALAVGYALQAVAMAGTAVVLLSGAPSAAAYVLAAVAASAVTITRPAQAASVAALVDHPDELTAATALSSWIDAASVLTGPALAGGLIAIDGPGLVFAVFAGTVALGTLLVAGVGAPPHRRGEGPGPGEDLTSPLAGLAALRSDTDTRALLGVLAVQYIAVGALDVLEVVLAIAVLKLGAPAAGYLGAAFGAGGLIGGAGALGLIGARSLARPLVGAALLWAVAYAALGLRPVALTAFPLLAAAGVGRAVLDVAGRTLLARITASHVLARVFGVLEGLTMAGLAVGSLLVPGLVSLGGSRAALIGVAVILAVVTLLCLPRLLAIDRRGVASAKLMLVRGHGLFAVLPAPVIEGVAGELEEVRLPRGRVVIREGDVGDRFYLIEIGEVEVSVAGEPLRRLGPGAGFGEIALLHNVRRTATVAATENCVLYALAREPFLDALVPAV